MTSAPLVLAGETSLGQTAAVIERCVLAIGGDTGLSHCAFACRVPLVFIQGSSPPCNAPKGDRTAHLLALCDDRPCPKDTRCKRGEGRPCLEAITVPQVLEACRALLTGAGTAPAYRSAPT
jgi:heptosyltransferase-2